MSKNDGTFGMMGPYVRFIPLYSDSVSPLSAIRGGRGKLSKENTMEDKRAEELQRKISQYELVADLLSAAYRYSGVLTTDYILAAVEAAAEIIEQDLDEDTEDTPEDVEDSPGGVKLELNYQPPHVAWTEQTVSFADYGPTAVTDDHMSHVHKAQSGSENPDDR